METTIEGQWKGGGYLPPSNPFSPPLIQECEICGEHRTITFSVRPYRGAQVDKQVVVDNPLRAFVRWLLFELPSLPAFQVTMAFSHFGGRFDMMFVFREIYLMGIIPKVC